MGLLDQILVQCSPGRTGRGEGRWVRLGVGRHLSDLGEGVPQSVDDVLVLGGDGLGAELVELEEVGVVRGEVDQDHPDGQERFDGIVLELLLGLLAQVAGELTYGGVEEAGFGREVLVAGGRGHLAGTSHAAQRHLAPAVGLDEVQGGVDESLTGVRAAPVYLHTR